ARGVAAGDVEGVAGVGVRARGAVPVAVYGEVVQVDVGEQGRWVRALGVEDRLVEPGVGIPRVVEPVGQVEGVDGEDGLTFAGPVHLNPGQHLDRERIATA